MVELNSFIGRGIAELPIGICCYLFPSYLPLVGLDISNPASLLLIKAYGIAVITLSLLSIYTGNLEATSPLRKQVALVLMGYSSMMITLLMGAKGLIQFNVIKQLPSEITMCIIHGMFCYEFYQVTNSGFVTTGTPGVTID